MGNVQLGRTQVSSSILIAHAKCLHKLCLHIPLYPEVKLTRTCHVLNLSVYTLCLEPGPIVSTHLLALLLRWVQARGIFYQGDKSFLNETMPDNN